MSDTQEYIDRTIKQYQAIKDGYTEKIQVGKRIVVDRARQLHDVNRRMEDLIEMKSKASPSKEEFDHIKKTHEKAIKQCKDLLAREETQTANAKKIFSGEAKVDQAPKKRLEEARLTEEE